MEHQWDQSERPFRLRPLGEKVVVRWVDKPKQVGRILLPDTAENKKYRAVVVSVGPDVKKLAQSDVGATVITQLYTAEVALKQPDGSELTVMDQGSILAVIEFEDEPKAKKK